MVKKGSQLKAGSVSTRDMLFGFPDLVEDSFMQFKAARTQPIICLGFLFFLSIGWSNLKRYYNGGGFDFVRFSHDTAFVVPGLLLPFSFRHPRLVEAITCVSALYSAFVTQLLTSGFVTSDYAVTRRSFFDYDAGLLAFWLLRVVLLQMRTPLVILVRVAMLWTHAQLLQSLGASFAFIRSMYMSILAASVGMGLDYYHRKAFVTSERCTGTQADHAAMLALPENNSHVQEDVVARSDSSDDTATLVLAQNAASATTDSTSDLKAKDEYLVARCPIFGLISPHTACTFNAYEDDSVHEQLLWFHRCNSGSEPGGSSPPVEDVLPMITQVGDLAAECADMCLLETGSRTKEHVHLPWATMEHEHVQV